MFLIKVKFNFKMRITMFTIVMKTVIVVLLKEVGLCNNVCEKYYYMFSNADSKSTNSYLS